MVPVYKLSPFDRFDGTFVTVGVNDISIQENAEQKAGEGGVKERQWE